MIQIEPVGWEVVIFRLENDYIRMEADTWYFHDKVEDSYRRVPNSNNLEAAYQEARVTKNSS